MNYQTNRNNCSCAGESRSSTCPYGRTPWGSRECGTCNRRPWNTRSDCGSSQASRNASCPCTANTTWKNRGANCSCNAARFTSCPCANAARDGNCTCTNATRNASCSCAESRDGDCDSDCNRGAVNTGILDGKSLAMVYSPYQKFDSLYDPRQGLCNGTIFGELNKPFHGDGRGC